MEEPRCAGDGSLMERRRPADWVHPVATDDRAVADITAEVIALARRTTGHDR
jgi:hypothetical protein